LRRCPKARLVAESPIRNALQASAACSIKRQRFRLKQIAELPVIETR
jgi:hypothetical protein